MHHTHLAWCTENVAFAIYQHLPQGSQDADWFAAERLLAQHPFPLDPDDADMTREAFQERYGKAVYYHTMNHIIFVYEGESCQDPNTVVRSEYPATFLHRTLRLHNRYFGLRHGKGKANEREIILSDLYTGQLEEYSLTNEGERQVRTSVEALRVTNPLDPRSIIIVSSPFSRCRRTAEIAKDVLGVSAQIIFDERLGERWFGDWEQTSHTHYSRIWTRDRTDPEHTEANIESAGSVQRRASSLICALEVRYRGKIIFLASHGDTLQIMDTGFTKQSPAAHREIRPWGLAEIREFHLHDP